MEQQTRSSLSPVSADDTSDYESTRTQPVSPAGSDSDDGMAYFNYDVAHPNSFPTVAALVRSVQAAAGRSAEGDRVNSPQLDPQRQMQVLQREQREQAHQQQQFQHQQQQWYQQNAQPQLPHGQGPPQPPPPAADAIERQQELFDIQRQVLARRHLDTMQRIQQYRQYQMMRQQQDPMHALRGQDVEEAHDDPTADGNPLKYQCRMCPARFSHANLLTRHCGETHPVAKPHLCPECGRGYVHEDVMESHRQLVHLGARPFPCDQCGKVFARELYLQSHMRVHTGFKPYSCPFRNCDRRFAWWNCLDAHRRTHTGERPYLCTTCFRDFAERSTLKMHEMIHTNSFPFPCDQCDRRFRRAHALREHQAVGHRAVEEPPVPLVQDAEIAMAVNSIAT